MQENVVFGGNFTFSNLNSENATIENVEDTLLEEMVDQVTGHSIAHLFSCIFE
jgi:hypothetical protein